MKLLEEKIGVNLHYLGLGQDIIRKYSKAWSIKKIKWTSSKLKIFVLLKTLFGKWEDKL